MVEMRKGTGEVRQERCNKVFEVDEELWKTGEM